MFRKNETHLQPLLMGDLNSLSVKQRRRLEDSWAGVFYHEFFCRLDETAFAVLYSDEASRPNVPVNVLVGLEVLKSGFGWSDCEMHDAFTFDVQVRFALGYQNLGEGEFELRTVYNFRQRLAQHMQETGQNLLDKAFAQVTDGQIRSFQLKTARLRMDSTQIASNIRQMTRLQLLVEVLHRVHRMLSAADQLHYAATFAPYLQGSSGQYVYHIRGDETSPHFQAIGTLMQRLLAELAPTYHSDPTYPMLQRVFCEQFSVTDSAVQARAGADISPSSLRSPDDPEATYRRKGCRQYEGYVANVTETCEPENPFQLVVKSQAAPNTTEDSTLLVEALPELKQRTGVEILYNDAGFCGKVADQVLRQFHVTQVPTGLRGHAPNPHRLNLSDFQIHFTLQEQPCEITCPQGQTVAIDPGRTPQSCIARFKGALCQGCPLQQRCPSYLKKSDPDRSLRFSHTQIDVALRRQRCRAYLKSGQNLRSAVEAAIGAIKRPFPEDQLPVRGQFRVAGLMLCSAAMLNLRRIQRYLSTRPEPSPQEAAMGHGENAPELSLVSFWTTLRTCCRRLRERLTPHRTALSFGC